MADPLTSAPLAARRGLGRCEGLRRREPARWRAIDAVGAGPVRQRPLPPQRPGKGHHSWLLDEARRRAGDALGGAMDAVTSSPGL